MQPPVCWPPRPFSVARPTVWRYRCGWVLASQSQRLLCWDLGACARSPTVWRSFLDIERARLSAWDHNISTRASTCQMHKSRDRKSISLYTTLQRIRLFQRTSDHWVARSAQVIMQILNRSVSRPAYEGALVFGHPICQDIARRLHRACMQKCRREPHTKEPHTKSKGRRDLHTMHGGSSRTKQHRLRTYETFPVAPVVAVKGRQGSRNAEMRFVKRPRGNVQARH